jgi:hypothetical protein
VSAFSPTVSEMAEEVDSNLAMFQVMCVHLKLLISAISGDLGPSLSTDSLKQIPKLITPKIFTAQLRLFSLTTVGSLQQHR